MSLADGAALPGAIADIRALPGGTAPPGIAVAVSAPGIEEHVVDGIRHGPDLPMTLQTRHDLASITKIVGTTASLMRLVESGALTVGARVRGILPTASVAEDATLEDVLRHRAGLREWWPLYLVPGDPVAAADALPLAYPPRAGRRYSDLGFMLLGRIVAAVHGSPLPDAVDDLVLAPLGMSQTRFAHPAPDSAGRAAEVAASSHGDDIERRMIDTGSPYRVPFRTEGYAHWRTGTVLGEVNDGNAFHAFGGVSGHAGLFSTVPDLLRFGRGLLSFPALADFAAPGPDPVQALGFRRYAMPVGDRTVEVLGHPGFTGSAVGVAPSLGAVIVMATNRLHVDGPYLATEEMWGAVLRRAGELLA